MIAVNGVTDTNSVQGSLLTDREEILNDFAKLQMELANANKSVAMDGIDKIKEQ